MKDARTRAIRRRLARKASTLIDKLDKFQELSFEIVGETGIPSVENMKQEMIRFYMEESTKP